MIFCSSRSGVSTAISATSSRAPSRKGGEANFVFMTMSGLAVIGIIHALLVMSATDLDWWPRFVLWPVALFVFPVLAMLLGFVASDVSTAVDSTPTAKLHARLTLPALLLTYCALNFWALSSTRA